MFWHPFHRLSVCLSCCCCCLRVSRACQNEISREPRHSAITPRQGNTTLERQIRHCPGFDWKGRERVTEKTDNDNDHSYRQLPVNKALTCPEGQSAWAVALLDGEGNSLNSER